MRREGARLHGACASSPADHHGVDVLAFSCCVRPGLDEDTGAGASRACRLSAKVTLHLPKTKMNFKPAPDQKA